MLLKSAMCDEDPVLFFEHYFSKGEVPDGDCTISFGQANVVRQGSDVTLIAIGGMLRRAVQAADALAGEGIRCEVIDPRTLVPLDAHSLLASVGKTGRVVIAHKARRPRRRDRYPDRRGSVGLPRRAHSPVIT